MSRLTKPDVVRLIAQDTSLSKKDVLRVLTSLTHVVTVQLMLGNEIMISGLGKVSVRTTNERKYTDYRTGKFEVSKPHSQVKISPSKALSIKVRKARDN